MDKVTQQNASMAEESTAASQSLARESETLRQLIAQFHLPPTEDHSLRRQIASAAPHVFAQRPNSAQPAGRNFSGTSPVQSKRAMKIAGAGKPTIIEEWDDF